MSCTPSSAPKYNKRPSPPIPANDCDIGTIATGNDGKSYQIVAFNSKAGVSHRWVSCDKASTNCGKQSKKVLKPSAHKTVTKINSKSEKTVFSVTGKVKLNRILKERSIKNPTKEEIYKYLKSKKRYVALINNIADYQNLYDKIKDQKINPDLTLSFTLQVDAEGRFSSYRKRSYGFNADIPTASQVKKDLVSSISGFADGCYGGPVDGECHYPVLQKGPFKNDLFGEFTVNSVKVSLNKPAAKVNKPASKVNKPASKVNKKTCPPGKVLSPKGRCVIDRSAGSKKTKTTIAKKTKSTVAKECPPGKVLSPKGRCVIDRSSSKKKSWRQKYIEEFDSPPSTECVERFEKKYQSRPGPPYPANDCPVNTMKTGNNGLMYVAKSFDTSRGRINRWVKM